MKSLVRAGFFVALVWLQLSGISFAKQVYLKDGGELECQSFWRSGGQIVVKVNRDVVLEFAPAEVDMAKTFPPAKRKGHPVKRQKKMSHATSPAAVTAGAPGQPAANVQQGGSPVQAKTAASQPATSKTAKGAAQPESPASPVKQTTPPAAAPSAQAPKAAAQASSPAAPPHPAPGAVKEAAPSETADATAADPTPPLTKEELNRRARENAEMMAQALKNHDAELMKKAIEAQKTLVQQQQKQLGQQQGGAGQVGPKAEPPWFKYFLMMIASMLIIIISLWVIFARAGEPGWKSIIPIYNVYILMLISGKPGWWFLLTFIPVVGAAIMLMAMLSLAEKFGRSALFGVGLAFLPMFFFPMMAFGGSKYGSEPEEMNFTFSEPPQS